MKNIGVLGSSQGTHKVCKVSHNIDRAGGRRSVKIVFLPGPANYEKQTGDSEEEPGIQN